VGSPYSVPYNAFGRCSPWRGLCRLGRPKVLLGLAVRPVLPAIRTELLHLQALGGCLLVLRARVVPVLTFLTLERDDLSRHRFTSTPQLSTRVALSPISGRATFARLNPWAQSWPLVPAFCAVEQWSR